MKWFLDDPQSGDVVRVKDGCLYRYGIFSDEGIIVFDGKVHSVCVQDFLKGGFLEVGRPAGFELLRCSRKNTLKNAFARARLSGYNTIYNNGEQFVFECALDKKKCEIIDKLRGAWSNAPLLHMYYAIIPTYGEILKISPPARMKEIKKCKNGKLERQKYYVWKLLGYALEKSLGYRLQDIHFKKENNGKWTCKECFFSLSHSGDMVAVAISREPVGVDAEKIVKRCAGLADKILTPHEKMEYARCENKEEYLIKAWTMKEAAFKRTAMQFIPSRIEENCYSIVSDGYVISVVGNRLDNIIVQKVQI